MKKTSKHPSHSNSKITPELLSQEYQAFLNSKPNAPTEEEVALGSKDHEFIKTLNQTIAPSKGLLVAKFVPIALLSGFLSLFLCPQFGITPYKIEPDFYSHLLHQNMFICGAYCGLILYISLNAGAFFYFNHYEKLQFKKQLSLLPFAMISVIWACLMWTSNTHYSGSLKYNIGWLIAALFGLIYSLYRSKQAEKMAVGFEKHQDF